MTSAINSSGSPIAFQINGIDSAYVTQSGIGSGIIPITASVAGNALTISMSSVPLDFRKNNLADGTVNKHVVSNLSITVPQGATLGTVSGVGARLAVIVARNGGSPVMCVANIAGGLNLDETNTISPTTISASATSANVIYSASAISSSTVYRVVGFVDITQATAGTWASAPTLVQGMGGQALASMGSLGYGQTWQSVARVAATTYYNTTGKPIILNVYATSSSASVFVDISINGGAAFRFCATQSLNGGVSASGSVLIPPGASYILTDTNVVSRTNFELR